MKMWSRTSKIFWPVVVTPKNANIKNPNEITSRSQKLLSEMGLIKPATNGTFQIMPIAQRSVDKCMDLINQQMKLIDGQKITLPILTPTSLWKKSGRLEGNITEFYIVRDRHDKEFLLSPTHEEAISAMLGSIAPISYKQLPLKLYQIGPKFRDELKARFGLLRAKEFYMKDMYTFDSDCDKARDTYCQLREAYDKIFKCLQVPYVDVEACTGMMGGSMSHEYHFISETGEDRLFRCRNCGYSCNGEVLEDVSKISCSNCKKDSSHIEEIRGIEIGHTFLLGDRYTKALGATYLNDKGKTDPLIMGCYGIGITRLLAASLEVLSTEKDLRWPMLLAPYDVCLIGPKHGSKEQDKGDTIERELCQSLSQICGADNIILDDRKNMTIGKRLMEAKRMGYPNIIVIGNTCVEDIPKVEYHSYGGIQKLMDVNELLCEVSKYHKEKIQLNENSF